LAVPLAVNPRPSGTYLRPPHWRATMPDQPKPTDPPKPGENRVTKGSDPNDPTLGEPADNADPETTNVHGQPVELEPADIDGDLPADATEVDDGGES